MKKLTLSLFALASVFAALAAPKTIIKYDFEDAQNQNIKTWDKKPIEIVDAKQAAGGSKHAIKISSISYFATNSITETGTYEYSIDSKYIWGKDGELKVMCLNKKTNNFDLIVTEIIKQESTYSTTTAKFKVKEGGYYRFVITPGGQGGNLLVDNVTVKKVK
ncbi:MAG: hypothetical protein SNH13_03015 [Rikenellaceae bacterium]